LTEVSGFLKASGTKVVNGEGREVLLRGVGFGSWLLPEGYMWRFPDAGDRPRNIERMIRELVGPAKAESFWETYYENYVSKADIDAVRADGFNSVRVPINARFLLDSEEPLRYREDHLRLLDRVIDWCRDASLYVVLDLHGAPGGQTGTNIDDSENDKPELFTDERNQRLTVSIWRMLAERYKDEWIVAGYDLLNEPLPNWFAQYNERVMPLYKDIVKAIREVDDRHMIILEGVHWATDWSIFTENIDDNVMYQFHKYWNNPDTESIQTFLDKRKELNAPIFMGEGGENNCDWYAGAFRLFEDHNISWNFWTWKKLDCTNSPYSVRVPEGWQSLISYLEGGEKPDPESAERTLWQYLENLKLSNCDYRPQVVNALFRRPPVRIPAVFYGYRGDGASYETKGKVEHGLGFRAGDGTDIRFVAEGARAKPNFQHMKGEEWLEDEWLYVRLSASDRLTYEFTLRDSGRVNADFRLRTDGGRLLVSLNDRILGEVASDSGEWETKRLSESIHGNVGLNKIQVLAQGRSVDLKWLSLTPEA